MSTLPPCDYRVDTGALHRYFCQHPLVFAPNSLVFGAACQVCPTRLIPRADRRLVATATDAPPEMPTWIERAWNLSQALTDFVADGMKLVSTTEYEQRLRICDTCDQRVSDNCRSCGCQLKLKAQGRAFRCPLGRWPENISGGEKS